MTWCASAGSATTLAGRISVRSTCSCSARISATSPTATILDTENSKAGTSSGFPWWASSTVTGGARRLPPLASTPPPPPPRPQARTAEHNHTHIHIHIHINTPENTYECYNITLRARSFQKIHVCVCVCAGAREWWSSLTVVITVVVRHSRSSSSSS